MIRAALHSLLTLILLLCAGKGDTPASPGMPRLVHYAAAPFGTIWVSRPPGPPKGVALFLSDLDGVQGPEMAIAAALARRGVMVALLSTPDLMRQLDRGTGCLNLNYPLIALSNDVQHRMAVRAYMKPVVMGFGTGATLAYASLSQWAKASYAGVVSIGWRPAVATSRPWCAVPGFTATQGPAGWQFGANPQISLPWTILQPGLQPDDASSSATRLVAAVPDARLTTIPAEPDVWGPPVTDALVRMLPQLAAHGDDRANPVPDMPLTIVEAKPQPATAGMMAIMYSGDGGWVGIDHDVSGQLAAAGIPVVGVDSLSYFWTARTPEGAAKDLGRLINAFSTQWRRPRVMLVGYSFGADVLPAMVGGLDPRTRTKVVRLSLLGLSSTADFQFHLSSWLDVSSDNALPTLPAVEKLKGLTIQCVRGMAEQDSACTGLPAGLAEQYLVPGDHHFNRNAPLLRAILLQQRRPGTVVE